MQIKMIGTVKSNQIACGNECVELNEYVDKVIDKLMVEHDALVKEQYYFKKEFTEKEYIDMLNDVENKMDLVPDELMKKVHGVYFTESDARNSWRDQCLSYKHGIERDYKRYKEFQEYIEDKRRELMNIPTDCIKVISNLKEYTEKQCRYYYKDVFQSYYDMFVDKVKALCPDDKDYSKTIKCVYEMKQSKKAVKILNEFFNRMKSFVLQLIDKLNEFSFDKFVEVESEMKRWINALFMYDFDIYIVEFIEKRLNYVDDEVMSDSKLVKRYCEHLMSEMNDAFIKELPEELDEHFKERTLCFAERFNYYCSEFKPLMNNDVKAIEHGSNTAEIKDFVVEDSVEDSVDENVKDSVKPGSNTAEIKDFVVKEPMEHKCSGIKDSLVEEIDDDDERTIESFMKTLTDEYIECNELLNKYNEYFGTEYKSSGFGKLKVIQNNFEKKSNVKRQGKWLTLYRKLNP